MSRLQELLEEIHRLEERISDEISREAEGFGYSIRQGRVYFEKEVIRKHRALAKRVKKYLAECSFSGLLVSPIIYSLIIPIVVFDLFVWLYQTVCFPVYKLPKVKRADYLVIDRHKLRYLNPIERFNCVYCSYANGFIAYVQEVAARSEQYWCPIKHAQHVTRVHSRYHTFSAYGDAEGYRVNSEKLRRELAE